MSPRSVLRARPRSLRGPILAALALIATVVAGMFATLVVTVHSLDTVSAAQRETNEMTQSTLELERTVVDLETGVRGYMLTDNPRFLERYNQGRERIAMLSAQLQRLSPPAVRPRVDAMTRQLDDYITGYTEPLIDGTRRPSVLAATTEGKERLDALRARFAGLTRVNQALTLQRRAHSQALRLRVIK